MTTFPPTFRVRWMICRSKKVRPRRLAAGGDLRVIIVYEQESEVRDEN